MFIALGLCLFVSFFLSGSETALTASNRMKIQFRADQGDIKSIKLRKLLSKPDRMITAILIGNNVANILMPTIVTMIAIDKGLHVGLMTGILTVVLIIFGEVLPKTIAATFADRIAYIVAPAITLLVKLFTPLTVILAQFTNFFVRLISKGAVTEATLTKEDVRSMVDIASTEGTFGQDESIRLKGVLDFRDKDVMDVMETHRTDIISLSMDSSYEDVRDVVLQYFYTRYPVYEESIDRVVGIFYSKMLIEWSMYPEKKFSEMLDRQPLFVVQTASVELVFKRMLTQKKHMAIVLDEYGGTLGIVTQEDIIEEMIGQDIEDETDVAEDAMVFEKDENLLICQGRLDIEDVIELLDVEIPTDHDTIGGFVFQELGHIPEAGEVFQYNSLRFEVIEMDRTKILRLQITKIADEEELVEA
ncbi:MULTISPECIES: hemolysin family protein [unclassified Sporosarcina]|uniref:hemolysin family protein n=1 Tax=unclassified Sporosarcina TaxID=2647733 RepID=UPI00203C36AE|nr:MULTISPECIES: CNNM domain-containing protein [unclassified Sporosarcina]GKV65101.1 hemolysin [Sporosarcina sp. NCCP-2331]GLB55225.1 hemolysin [Sporosarcina sp. NCCP-2378]